MIYRPEQPPLFDGDGHGRRLPPGLKPFLYRLNLQIDWLLGRIDAIHWAFDPILWANGETEIEKLTLLLEDRWFFEHSGIDLRAIPRVIRQLLTLKKIGGVSTIEQQLVRTLLDRRERTLRRKSREIILSWILSHRLDKREILRTYLSTAYFGFRLRGCDEVSEVIFSKEASVLKTAEAAFVASLLVYPLPKAVREFGEANGLHPIADLQSYFEAVAPVAPRWAKRVRRRMNYGLARRRKTK